MPKKTCKPKPSDLSVVLAVRGGMPDGPVKPQGVRLTVCDDHVEGVDRHDPQLTTGPDGSPACIERWAADQAIVGNERDPIDPSVRNATEARVRTQSRTGFVAFKQTPMLHSQC